MNYLFGIFQRTNAPVEPIWMDALARAALNPHALPAQTWYGDGIALGVRRVPTTPEAKFETLPSVHPSGAFVMVAASRLDNRAELCEVLDISPAEAAVTSDPTLMSRAYEKWRTACANYLVGDWSMAVWDERRRELFLARDHHGNTTLYYYCDAQRIVFSSSLVALFCLPFVPRQPNELYIAKTLTSWMTDGTETAYAGICRLPPAHTLTVSATDVTIQRYWFLEHAPDIHFKRTADYVDAFREVYARAVHDRLRANAPIAATLSGGLDSGSTCALAAPKLAERGETLQTYTSVPLFDAQALMSPGVLADEAPFARASAKYIGNIRATYLDAADSSPVAAVRRMLNFRGELTHAAGNYYWLVALLSRARSDGNRVLLTGQGGNATVSWSGLKARALTHLLQGRPSSAADAFQTARSHSGILLALRSQFGSPIYHSLRAARSNRSGEPPWTDYSAIHPAFAEKIHLAQRMQDAHHDPNFSRTLTPRAERFAIIGPGRSTLGAAWQDNGAAFDLEVRDATFDKRVMEFCIGVPEREYLQNGQDRLLMRRAMQGYLPDVVRLNTRRGRQGADLGYRLLAHRAEFVSTLDSLDKSPLAQSILDLAKIRETWNALKDHLDYATNVQCQTILLRGVMVGIYLLTFESGGVE